MSEKFASSSNEQSPSHAEADAAAAFEAAQTNPDLRFDPAARQAFMDERQTSRETAEASKNTQDWLEAVEDGYGPMLESAEYKDSMPKAYEDMTLTELLVPYVEASKRDDRTSKEDIDDVLIARAGKLRRQGKAEEADHMQEGFAARVEAAMNRDDKKGPEAAAGAGTAAAATAAEAGSGSSADTDPGVATKTEAEDVSDPETDALLIDKAIDIVSDWDERYKNDNPLTNPAETLLSVESYMKAASELIYGDKPIHKMTIKERSDSPQFKQLEAAIDQIARSRGCEDEKGIDYYRTWELHNIVLASKQHEDTQDMVVSSDAEEIKTYWEENISHVDGDGNETMPYNRFVTSEGTALIKRPANVAPGDPVPKENPQSVTESTQAVPAEADPENERDYSNLTAKLVEVEGEDGVTRKVMQINKEAGDLMSALEQSLDKAQTEYALSVASARTTEDKLAATDAYDKVLDDWFNTKQVLYKKAGFDKADRRTLAKTDIVTEMVSRENKIIAAKDKVINSNEEASYRKKGFIKKLLTNKKKRLQVAQEAKQANATRGSESIAELQSFIDGLGRTEMPLPGRGLIITEERVKQDIVDAASEEQQQKDVPSLKTARNIGKLATEPGSDAKPYPPRPKGRSAYQSRPITNDLQI